MAENESSEWIYNEWQSIDAKVADLEKKLEEINARTEKLLVDIEFVRMMFEEELL